MRPVRTLLLIAALTTAATTATASAAHPAGEGAVGEVETVQQVNGEEVLVTRHGDPLEDFTENRARSLPSIPAQALEDGGTAREVAPTCATVDRTNDDATNAAQPPSSSVIKVIYAYPTNVGNRLGTYGPVIQAGVKAATERIAGESGNTRSLRFDLGTGGGETCVDIQRIALTGPASLYTASSQTFSLIRTELTAKVGTQPGIRNYLVYLDGIAVPGVAGEAQVRNDDSIQGMTHNVGGLWAMLYGRGGTDFYGSGTAFAPGTTSRSHVDTLLHEISHNLGAVQRSAPHRSASWHCLDESDVLCYDDDGSGGYATFNSCAATFGQVFDCNKDDYFNPSPAGGSYLATHWNTFNSTFMCPVENCAAGGVTGPPAGLAITERGRPQTTIVLRPRGKTRDRTPTFGFTSTELNSTFRCKLDKGPYRTCPSPYTLRKQRLRRHVLRVLATDSRGLTDETPAVAKFKVVARPR